MLSPFIDVLNGDEPEIAPHAICDSCGHHSGPSFVSPQWNNSYAHSNQQLSDTDGVSILASIEQEDLEILQLDKEIFDLQNVIKGLYKKRSLHEKIKAVQLTRFAPISKLPEDVLRHLFSVCQQELDDDGYIDVLRKRTFVRTVTQISSYWRYLAFSCPELWSRIRTRHFTYTPLIEDHRMWLSFIERCIILSAKVPLSIDFDNSMGWVDEGGSCHNAIAQSAYRWKDIRFKGLFKFFSSSRPVIQLPRLNSLHIEGLMPVPRFMIPTAQSLTSLKLYDMYLDLSDHTFTGFPWSQIRNFECAYVQFKGATDYSGLIGAMPNLVSLLIHGRDVIFSYPVNLASLKLLDVELFNHGNLWDMLTAPSLESLEVRNWRYPGLSATLAFLRRSNCSITSLGLRTQLFFYGVRDEWNTKLLRHVRYLSLRRVQSPELFARWYQQGSTDLEFESMFPRLESLTLLEVESNPRREVVPDITAIRMALRCRRDDIYGGIGGLPHLKLIKANFEGQPLYLYRV